MTDLSNISNRQECHFPAELAVAFGFEMKRLSRVEFLCLLSELRGHLEDAVSALPVPGPGGYVDDRATADRVMDSSSQLHSACIVIAKLAGGLFDRSEPVDLISA